ncbi:MAG: polysaccharide deacetylase family protein [Chloroflexi bacterium]|nr:polysaccharide deacetylase family protein [Chloroflexota bacterium]
MARDHPDLIRELAASGHEIACHTMTHPNLWPLTAEEYRKSCGATAKRSTRRCPAKMYSAFARPCSRSTARRTGRWACSTAWSGCSAASRSRRSASCWTYRSVGQTLDRVVITHR